MENNTMKKHKTSLTGFVLGILVLLVGVQGVFAQQNVCKGTIYIKAPDDWGGAVYVGGWSKPAKKATLNEDGYYVFDLSTIGVEDANNAKFAVGNNDGKVITTTGYNVATKNANDASWATNDATFKCPGEGTITYITENPLRPGKTYTGEHPSDAKFFYMLVPEEKEWQSDDLMISYTTTRGTKKDTAMTPSSELCGWVYMVFETAPADAIIYLKNNPTVKLGTNGLWDEDGEADPIDLGLVFDAYGVNKLYFIPDDAAWPDENSQGWYTTDPQIEGTCSFSLAAVIYDTDMDLNTAFSDCCDEDKGKAPAGVENCVGVQYGLVKTDLGPDNKPVFAGTAAATSCFGSEANFNAFFNYVPNVNEVQCYDMPFRHYGTDTRWGFDSDSMVTNGYTGGFYPLETSGTPVTLTINGVPTVAGPTTAARKKRAAAGPVPNNAVEVLGVDLDHYCWTPGFPDGKKCNGKFADGDDLNGAGGAALWCWGSYCDPSFKRWGKDGEIGETQKRNQHFCFESHATFTYNETQEFTFRGDDDIWVFINKKIAVDNGGAHLAAPGHVVLKNLNTTYGAGFLVPGQDYPIDIFFCDRRTTMSNVIIKTNMYIKQSTGLDFSTQQTTTGGLQLDICVEKSGGGDCASVALGGGGSGQQSTRQCGGNIETNVSYSITTRKGENPAGCSDCAALTLGQVVHGGIDLTNPKIPVVYPEKIIGLAPGSYRLVIEVEGKKTHYNFRVKGNLGIVSSDVVFDNVDGEESVYASGTKWKFVGKGLAGTRVPIYISAPDGQGGVDLISAPNQSYTLTLSAGVTLYKTNDKVNDVTPLTVPYSGVVNPTGIDTLWLDVPLAGFTSAELPVTATVGNTQAIITFYAPIVQFSEPLTKDDQGNVLTWKPVTQDPDVDPVDGSEYFHWVSADVDFYVTVLDPTTGGLCTYCDFTLDLLDKSDGISGSVSQLNEGVALVRIRSVLEYATTPATMIVGSTQNLSVAASYGNMHFYKPPAPMPLIVDMFDVKGAPTGEMNIPSEFYSESDNYLDGKADSMAIIYDRVIDKDSIPTFICLNFDEENLVKINPYDKGISNNPKDTEMYCSTQFEAAAVKEAYAKSPDGGRTLVFAIDSSFTPEVKTIVKPDNKIASFTEYQWKGKVAKTFFEKGLTDRIAPVILSARASTETDGGVYDQVKIIVSEPVKVVDASVGKQAFSYYLNSAIDIASESARYIHVMAQGVPQNGKDTLVIRYYNADPNNPTPHVGDYIRFRADNVVWTDSSNGFAEGSDTLRQATDADWHWNSPTNYNSQKRLASPWVQVVGDAKIDVNTIVYNTVDPSSVNDSTPVGKVYPVKTSENLEDIKAKYPDKLGHFVQSDMGAIIGSEEINTQIEKSEVYFYYEVDYFTNLGAFVARQSGKISCTDPFFSTDPEHTPEGMGDCVKNPRNFFVAWNMVADNHRVVGTGAYITKYASFVKLGDLGKRAKKELTEVWGVKRGKGKVAK